MPPNSAIGSIELHEAAQFGTRTPRERIRCRSGVQRLPDEAEENEYTRCCQALIDHVGDLSLTASRRKHKSADPSEYGRFLSLR